MAERVTREELAEALKTLLDRGDYTREDDNKTRVICTFCGGWGWPYAPIEHRDYCLLKRYEALLSRLDAEQNGGGE